MQSDLGFKSQIVHFPAILGDSSPPGTIFSPSPRPTSCQLSGYPSLSAFSFPPTRINNHWLLPTPPPPTSSCPHGCPFPLTFPHDPTTARHNVGEGQSDCATVLITQGEIHILQLSLHSSLFGLPSMVSSFLTPTPTQKTSLPTGPSLTDHSDVSIFRGCLSRLCTPRGQSFCHPHPALPSHQVLNTRDTQPTSRSV